MQAKPSYVFLNLPEFSELEDLGFGVPISHHCELPAYLDPWLFSDGEGVQFRSQRNPLLDEKLRRQIGSVAASQHDYLAALGTKNNASRILLACSTQNLTIVESAEQDWIRIGIDRDEWFELAAPKLLALEESLNLDGVDSSVTTACLTAAARYFGIELTPKHLHTMWLKSAHPRQ